MRVKEQKLARALRAKGYSLREISSKINCAKSTVSLWIRDVPLTQKQIKALKNAQDRGRAKAAEHPNSPKLKWHKIRTEISAKSKQIVPLAPTQRELTLVCAALYWGEGYKQTTSLFVFANSDPNMIALMMKFLINVCKVPQEKFRGRVNIFSGLNVDKAQHFWSKVSSIPIGQFHKPLLSVSRSSQHKRKTLPYGTFRIIICDVFLCSKIQGLISGLTSWAKPGYCNRHGALP